MRVCRLVAVVLLVLPSLAAAQSGIARGRGLFGAGSSNSRTMLNLGLELAEALESEIPVELRRRTPQGGLQSGGYSSSLAAVADFQRDRRVASITGAGVASFRHYQRVNRVQPVSHTAALGATLRLPRRTTIELNQTAAYAPSYLYQLFPSSASPAPGDVIPAAGEYRIDESKSYSYGTSLSFLAGSARGTRLNVAADRNRTDFRGRSASRPDLLTDGVRARLDKGIGRSVQFSAGYEYRVGEFGFGAVAHEHRVRIGGEYSRALSSSRRAQFRFSIAPSTMAIPDTARAATSGTLYRVEASTSVNYAFLRSWAIDGNYRRGVEYIAVLRTPVFQDAVRLQLGGLVTRRLDVFAMAGYSAGESALSAGNDSFDTYTGSVRGQVALGRAVAVFGEFLYYHYDMRGQSSLAPDLPSVFDQRSARVGMVLRTRPLGR
jgi:hypothetical protein